jgi:hypothetical protein
MLHYPIDGIPHTLHIENADQTQFGPPGRLSTPETDPTAGQPWYDRGFDVLDLFTAAEFAAFKDGLTATLRDALGPLGRDTTGDAVEFRLTLVKGISHG